MSEHTKEPLSAWSDDTALMGPEAPKWDGRIEHLIRYLLTVHKRFGNTTVTASLQWGASALWKRNDQSERIATLEQQNAELVAALKLCKKHMAGDKWDSLFIDGVLSKVKQP